jgi:hypothetical protein
MNWDAIGAIGEILGALSVLITLIYLATQVSEAKRATKAQTENAVQTAWGEKTAVMGESKEKASLVLRGFNSYDDLEAEEHLMFHTVLDSFVLEYQRQRNMFEEGVWHWKNRAEIESVLIMALSSPGGKQWWAEAKFWYMYRDSLDQLVSENRDLPVLNELSMFSIKTPDSGGTGGKRP